MNPNPNLNIYTYPNEPNPNGHLYFVSLSFSLSGWVNICWYVWASLIVSMCVPVCLAVECVEQALCVLSFSPCSADHWHLGPRGSQAPPRGPQHLLFLALPPLIFLIHLFLMLHLVFYMTKYYIWICANVTLKKYQYMFCSIFSNILLLTFQNSLSITQQKDKQETHS